MLALLIIGSVARGDARADSDVDCFLVVSDEEYRRCQATSALSFTANDLCSNPDGQAGGSVIDLSFLERAEARGPEPVRYAFSNAIVVFSRVAQIETIVRSIPVYQEGERAEKLISFASQLPVHLSYMVLGEYSSNPYLLAETAVEMVLFGGRLILAQNRMLYPNRKLFLRELERAPDKPPGLMDLAMDLLERPGIRTAQLFCDCILGFADWPQAPEGYMARFQKDRERLWLEGVAPLADR